MPVGYVTNFEPVGAGIGFGGTNLHQPPEVYDKTQDPVFPGNTPVSDPAISVRGLTKSFGPNTVLEDISIDFPRGKITTVLGPSGTGKSVFLRNVIGLLQPDRGDIWIGDDNIPTLNRKRLLEVRKRFGVLFQDGALFGSMNIYDNTAFLRNAYERVWRLERLRTPLADDMYQRVADRLNGNYLVALDALRTNSGDAEQSRGVGKLMKALEARATGS